GRVAQHFPADVGNLEGDAGMVAALPAADREDLAADLPDMRAAPLHDMGGGGERGAEGVEFAVAHGHGAMVAHGTRGCKGEGKSFHAKARRGVAAFSQPTIVMARFMRAIHVFAVFKKEERRG